MYKISIYMYMHARRRVSAKYLSGLFREVRWLLSKFGAARPQTSMAKKKKKMKHEEGGERE